LPLEFIFVPGEAYRRQTEVAHAAFRLFFCYCKHRDWETGRCDPSNETIREDTGMGYSYISTAKTNLLDHGWIDRRGKYAVELIVGAVEFERRRVRLLAAREKKAARRAGRRETPNFENRNLAPPQFRNSEFNSDQISKIETANFENRNLAGASPYTDDQGIGSGVVAATTAPAGAALWQEECDEAFVALVIESGTFPHQDVRHVWNKLKLRCFAERVPPSKGRLLHWLATERAGQPALPTMGASVTELGARQQSQQSPAKKCDHTCGLCFGSGFEVVAGADGRSASRKCPNSAAQAETGKEAAAS
jgi:hypothetical protein